MLRKSAAVLSVVFCLSNVDTSRADAGPIVNWLMNEPASLFDIGMLHIRIDLEPLESEEELGGFGGNVVVVPQYSFEKNRIQLLAALFNPTR